MQLLERVFGTAAVPLVVAEVGLGHDGSLNLAHAYVDAVAAAGGEAIKFQTHIADAESSPHEPFRVKFSHADATRQDYWRRTGFSEPQWLELKKHADARKLLFLSSPFSVAAVDLLERIGVSAWKIPSGEVGSRSMLDRLAATRKPVLLSTGMSRLDEVEAQVAGLRARGVERLAVLQCTTSYPTPPEKVGLNVMVEFARRLDCPVGLSDHSGDIVPSVVATWLGARVLEVHVAMSREMSGPDVSSSLTMEGFRTLLSSVAFAAAMRDNPVDKDRIACESAELRRLFAKSAMAARDVTAGEVVTPAHVVYRKPGFGIGEDAFERFLNRRAARHVAAGEIFKEGDFEQ